MEVVFGWLGQIFEALLLLLPRRVIIDATEALIKYVLGRKIKTYGPGLYWYWPLLTKIDIRDCCEQTINLEDQTLTTSDGEVVKVGGLIRWRLELKRLDRAALIKQDYLHEIIANECMALIQLLISQNSYLQICSGRKKITNILTKNMRRKLRKYGVYVHEASLTEFSKSRSLHISGVNLSLPA